MTIDVYGNYTGAQYGKDRLGHTTPDADASDWLRPWVPHPYPAPWLPSLRQDTGHPVGAGIVLTSGQLIGFDKNGYYIPAGLTSGTTGAAQISAPADLLATVVGTAGAVSLTYSVIARTAGGTTLPTSVTVTTANATRTNANAVELFWEPVNGAVSYDVLMLAGATAASGTGSFFLANVANETQFLDNGSFTATSYTVPTTNTSAIAGKYCIIQYGPLDVGFALNAKTGVKVASGTGSEYVVLAAPANGTAGDTVVGPFGTITIVAGDLTFAATCNLVPAGTAHAVGYVLQNVYQNFGGVTVTSTTGGVTYTVESNVPTNFAVHNYMHEGGNAFQTLGVLRLPWVGALESTIDTLAQGDSVLDRNGVAFARPWYYKTFVHAVGAQGNVAGTLFPGCKIVPAAVDTVNGYAAATGYAPYNSAIHTPDQIIGTCLALENLYPIHNLTDRVRTQWERANAFVGPWTEPNPTTMQMGGSATRGLDYALNLSGAGVFRQAKDQGKTARAEYSTYCYVFVRL